MDLSVFAWAIMAASIGCFATITWVSKDHFVSKGPLPPVGTMAIVAAALTSVAVFLWSIATAPSDSLAPVPFYAAAIALFLWAVRTTRNKGFLPSFSNVVPDALTVDGPYRFVRHPFYASYLLYHLGNAIATTSWLPWAMFALMLSIYVRAALNEESHLAQGSYAETYLAYRRRTGMFIPRVLPSA